MSETVSRLETEESLHSIRKIATEASKSISDVYAGSAFYAHDFWRVDGLIFVAANRRVEEIGLK